MREGTRAPARRPAAVSGRCAVLAALVVGLSVLVPALVLPDGDAGLVGAVVALALLAWAGRTDGAVTGPSSTVATTPAGAARRLARRAGAARQCDPDADGRPRPRAPGPVHRSRGGTGHPVPAPAG